MVKTQSVKTGIQKLPVSARMVTFLFREILLTVKVSELFNKVVGEKCIPGRHGGWLETITWFWSFRNLQEMTSTLEGAPFSCCLQASQ